MLTRQELFEGFTIGEWEVLPGQGVLRRGRLEERPEPKVFEVLVSLARRDGNLVTRDDLVNEVWGGRPTSDEPINRCLSQLRGHLGDRQRPHRYIETLQRRGYRLMQPVVLHGSTESSRAETTRRPPARPRRWKIVAAVLLLGFLAAIALMMRSNDSTSGIHSIALLPIDNLSGDPGNQFIVDGVKDVLARRLSEIPELAIKNTRVRYDEEPSRIAERLDVDSVLSGTVQLEGSTLKVTYLLTRGDDNVTIGSGEVEGDLDGIFALQERLAAAVRDELTGSAPKEQGKAYVPKSDAYNRYMRGLYALQHRGEADNLERAIALFQDSIRLDENYGPAYLSLATAYALLPAYRDLPVEETDRAAIQTVEKGIAVDGSIADGAGAIYGSALHQQKKWSESEAAYRRATSATVVDSTAFNWYSRMLASVGRLDDALAQALAAEAIDPDNGVINSRVAIAYTWLGQSEPAYEYFRRAESLGATGLTEQVLPYVLLLVRDGRVKDAELMAMKAVGAAGADTDWVGPVFAAFDDRSLRETALRALDEASAAGTLVPEAEVTARVILGDIEGAMAVARRLEEPGEIFAMDLLFTPEFQPLREHPEFMPLLERLGVVGYWKNTGCTFDGQKATCRQG